MPTSILLALADAGSANYVLPVLPALKKRFVVRVVVDPKGAAKKILDDHRVSYELWGGDALNLNGVRLVLCGTAGKKQDLWRRATKDAKSLGIRVAWFGDYFGSTAESALHDLSPNAVAVVDLSSELDFLETRTNFNGPVVIVGNPAFDALTYFNPEIGRPFSRKSLGLLEGETYVHYAASLSTQFNIDETLDIILPWVRRRRHCRFSIGLHPTEEADTAMRIRARVADELADHVIEVGSLKGSALYAACDAVLTDYSTAGLEAALVKVPTAYIMPLSVRKYQESRGRMDPYFPTIECGLCLRVSTPEEANVLDMLLTPSFKKGRKQALRARDIRPLADGKATNRFVDFVERMAA